VTRRPGPSGRGAALAVSAASTVPVARLPAGTVLDSRRLPRALAFAAFMALCAALWIAFPALAGWFVSAHTDLPLLSVRVGLVRNHTLAQLLTGGPGEHGGLAFGIHTLLTMSALGAGAFLYAYRSSSPVRRFAARDNTAC
jgi:hypothetical protein